MAVAPTAAMLVIGDEILKGHTKDTNSSFAARILYRLGVKLSRILVISDDKEQIAAEVRALSSQFTFVVTCGGVGPTHDDVTYEGVAAAFDMPLVRSKELAELVESFYKLDSSSSQSRMSALKMAQVPEKHELLYAVESNQPNKKLKWSPCTLPVIKVRNVFVYPGLPVCFEACFQGLQHCYPSALGTRFSDVMYLTIEESEISDLLDETIRDHQVVIGCYPILGDANYETKLTIEAQNLEQLKAAMEFIKAKVPVNTVVDLFPLEVALDKLQHSSSREKTASAFEIFEQCLKKYPDGEIVISFNGGKDCTLLLHLYHIFLRSVGQSSRKIKALYIKNQESFPEVDQFIHKAVVNYNLELIEYNDPIKKGVERLLADHPQVKAILMGNRSTDPYSSQLNKFQMTDQGWPQVMRVFPILDWSYAEVWQVMLTLSVDYCSLYNQGYTSLGNPENTSPNPALEYKDDQGKSCYKPAHTLKNGSEERAGRLKAKLSK